MSNSFIILAFCASLLTSFVLEEVGAEETHLSEEYKKRFGDSWPPRFVPNTDGWKRLMSRRLAQAAAIEDRNERYDAYVQTTPQAFTAPNFTEFGIGLIRAPEELTETLRREVISAYERGEAKREYPIKAIEGPQPCLFVTRPDLTKRVVDELHPHAESWAKVPLEKLHAYGFRFYRGNATLNMHVDIATTRVISMIYHIGHDDDPDSEPWPILIEDFEGQTHEVYLDAGDILLYESSKCLHGRPKPFKGRYYTSVFVNYYPANGWLDMDHVQAAQYAIPPHWDQVIPLEDGIPPLRLRRTSFKEPGCPNSWCSSVNTIKRSGPFEAGYLIDAKGIKHPFSPRLLDHEAEEL